jgi:hypothetical protein
MLKTGGQFTSSRASKPIIRQIEVPPSHSTIRSGSVHACRSASLILGSLVWILPRLAIPVHRPYPGPMSDHPHDQLARLVSGYRHTQAIYVAAKLGLADLLKDCPRPAQELAQATGTNPRALYRL